MVVRHWSILTIGQTAPVENTKRRKNQVEREARSLKSLKKWFGISPRRVTFTVLNTKGDG
jgi:hypothetical protein